jgi:sec-independent protein translocase protein TatB
MNLMPGIGFFEMVLLVVVAIVVIGPKDLPLMMRKFGRFTGKMRAMAFEFKQGFDELGRQAELEELRKEVADLKKHTGIEDIQREFEQDRINLEKDVNSAMSPASLPQPEPAHSAESKDPAPAHPAAAANGAAAPTTPMPSHAGLSAEHPGYDTGEDFRIEGGPLPETENRGAAAPAGEPDNASLPHSESPRLVTPKPNGEGAESKDQPVKQDAPA